MYTGTSVKNSEFRRTESGGTKTTSNLAVIQKKTLYLQTQPENPVEMEMIKYPIGTQSFKIIRENNQLYIDKTAYIPRLQSASRYIFLSRPRRFGKSLLISTLEAYFSNKRELFKGLAIDRMQPEPWAEYMVLHFDFSGHNYKSAQVLENLLNSNLSDIENIYGIQTNGVDDISLRFQRIVRTSYERTGHGVVILIDEYDNPITSAIGNSDLQEEFRQILYGFYSSLKTLDQYIHFCMLTGVTKYGKMSVFSGLNNLSDISFDDEFAGLCGVTEEELHTVLNAGVEKLALKLKVDTDEAYRRLKYNYDGYHFTEELIDIYNPFSIINALAKSSIRKYWAETGTPTMLVKLLEKLDFDVDELNGYRTDPDTLGNLSTMNADPVPLFYQTGYLTIKNYDWESDTCTLGFPNHEVKYTFMGDILKIYANAGNTKNLVLKLKDDLEAGKVKSFIKRMDSFLSAIPYDLRKRVAKYENYYHTIFYALAYLLGVDVAAEYHTSRGSIDLVMRTKNYIYILELKINGTAEDAIAQIHEKGYPKAFATDPRKTILIGLGFSKETNTISSDKVEPEMEI